jgi:hypothetical protein
MAMKHLWWLYVFLLLAAGCATPAYRIRKNPDLFASFPPEVQENVREGRVEVGYSPEMVYIALGRPSRVYSRQTEAGHTIIWAYSSHYHTSNWRPVERVHVYRDKSGRRYYTTAVDWVDVGGYTEYEAVRIEFADNEVTAVEILHR